MRALLVGAGAVGQVYGRHLQAGGAEVSFLVRPRYAAGARAGFDMYPLGRADARRAPVRFEGFGVLTTLDEVARERWDCVFLCVSSTALRQGDWLGALARAAGDATIVVLQPGSDDLAYARAHVPAERIVQGLIGLLAYQAPLPGEDLPRPGIAYWFPPLAETPISGPPGRALPIVAALRAGGVRSRLHPDVGWPLAMGGAVLGALVAALERSGWKIDRMRSEGGLELAARAARETIAIEAARLGRRTPLWTRLLGRRALGALVAVARRAAPLDIETYFRVHFTKVGDQMRLGLETHLARAAALGVDVPALAELAAAVGAAAAGSAS